MNENTPCIAKHDVTSEALTGASEVGCQFDVGLCRPLEQIGAIFRTNVLGPLATTRAFFSLMLKGTKKIVVNISSIIGSIDFHMDTIAAPEIMSMKTYVGGYSISKAALNMRESARHHAHNKNVLCIESS